MAKNSEPESKPRIGASYRAGTTAIVTLAPVTDELANSVLSKNFRTFPANLKAKALSVPYGANLAITAVDAALDAKLGHAAALSRGSVTAWAPEILRLASAAQGGSFNARGGSVDFRSAHGAFVESTTGYNPSTGALELRSPRLWLYQGAKRGLQLLRRLSNTSFGGRVLNPVKKTLSALGATF